MLWRILSSPVTPNTESCPNKLTRRCTNDEHGSSGYCALPDNRLDRNNCTSLRILMPTSVSWEVFGGNDISFTLDHMAFRSSNANVEFRPYLKL